MWTFKRAYKPLLPSLERISYHAESELNRSLNKNCLIAFIGSGVSLPYGRLNWSELCALLIMDIDKEFWKTFKLHTEPYTDLSNAFMEEAKFLHGTLRTVLGEGKINYDDFFKQIDFDGESLPDGSFLLEPTIDKNISSDTTILELCSELANLLDREKEENNKLYFKGSNCTSFLKNRAAKYLTEGILDQFGSRLKLLNGYGKNTLHYEWMRFVKKEIEKNKTENQHTFEEALDELKELEESKKIKDFSSEKWLINGKAFKRSAIEEEPWKLISKLAKDKEKFDLSVFKDLFKDLFKILSCASLPDAKIEQGDWADPIKTIIDDLNINRLVTLNYDTELERYFLCRKEYQTKSKNDHLLVKSTQAIPKRIAVRRNGFGAKFTSVTLEKNLVGKLINFASESKPNDSYIFHLHGRGDCPDDLILTEKDYQNLYVRTSKSRRAFSEGIDTLFSGNDVLFLGVGMNETDLLRPLRQFLSESGNASLRPSGILALLNKEENKQKTEEQALKLHTKFGVKSMFYDPETLEKNKELKQLKDNYSKQKVKLSLLSYQIKLMKLEREKIGIQSKAFDHKLKKLAKKQQRWWHDWRQPPGKRLATFVDWNQGKTIRDDKVATRLWIRQKVSLLTNEKGKRKSLNSKENSFSKNITLKKSKLTIEDIVEKIRNPEIISSNGRESNLMKVYRCAGETGVGKGSLVHAIQALCEKELTVDQYIGCFFSDAKFSTEYTSVISALSRFLAGILADRAWDKKESSDKQKFSGGQTEFRRLAEEENTFDQEWVSKELNIKLPSGKTKILETYLGEFEEKQVKQNQGAQKIPRLLICLSGLDRLVDKNGYAYNALHRSFFKVLFNPEKNKNIPLTLVLIADKPEIPIRYLSELHKNHRINKKGKKRKWDSQKAKLKKWDTLSKTKIKKRDWLPVCSLKAEEKISLSNACDKALGILSVDKDTEIENSSLERVAYDYVSVHLWLRLLLKKIIEKEKSGIYKESKRKEIFDSLELAASRKGVNGVTERILNIYDGLDTKPEKQRSVSAYQTILRHLALFSIPIERTVLVNCPEVVKAIYAESKPPASEREIAEELDGYLQTLNSTGLIIKIERSGSVRLKNKTSGADYRYTLASIMRKNLAQRMDFDAYTHGEFSFFDVSLYPTQPLDLPSPKERDFLFIGKILQNIISNARYNLDNLGDDKTKKKLDSIHSISRNIRAAVNLVNGSFSIGVVSRLDDTELNNVEYVCGHAQPFEAYNRWLRCLSNISVAIEQKKLADSDQNAMNGSRKEQNIILQKPLYETEAAWIYNEQALVNLIQGRLIDALQLFKMAKDRLDRVPWVDPDDTKSYPPLTSLRRVELNYAITMLESGMIKEAESEFTRLYRREKSDKRNKTSLTVHLACGYLGLCYHLQGRMTQAECRYEEALDYFKRENKNFLRVTAIFRLHYGNLKRTLNDYKSAQLYIDIAIRAAASAKQMDVFHHANVAKAKLLLTKAEKGYATKAIMLLNNASEYAEKMGLFKLKVHSDIIRGEILISQTQNTIAGKILANAIAIANKHGMRLMKLRALEVYGKALKQRGTDSRVTDEIFKVAKRLSENTGYLIKWVKEEY